MKHLLSILFVVLSINLVIARGGGGHSGGHSSSHSSSHSFGESSHSSSHTSYHVSKGTSKSTSTGTRVRSYTRVTHVEPSEIHMCPHFGYGGNNYLYYYLMYNHNTTSFDTIQSNTQADLITQVTELSDEDDSEMDNSTIGFIILGCLVFIVLVFFIKSRI